MATMLGVNAVFHDAAALVVDDRIVAAAKTEEERVTRREHGVHAVSCSTFAVPELAARRDLRHPGIGPEELDAVACSHGPALPGGSGAGTLGRRADSIPPAAAVPA